jgi:hypothetical protein
MSRNEQILIRNATAADDEAVAVLGVLDGSGKVPSGDVMVAEVDGRMRAAVGSDGVAISDPFWPSAELVNMLRMHTQVAPATRTRRFSRLPALRAAVGV